MPSNIRDSLGVAILWATAVLAAVVPAAAQKAPTGEPQPEGDAELIMAEAVDKTLAESLIKLHEQLDTLMRQQVETLVAETRPAKEAERRGILVRTLLDTEVTSKVSLVTEQEIETFYQANKARFKGDEAILREQIRAHLQIQKLAGQRETFVQFLRDQTNVVVHLKPPPIPRAEVSVDGAPFKAYA